ncbi:hypothetical protein K1Y78_20670 [Streptomyces sp. tea 10]|nr:hypothetical protein [Streptomyces sp. tea 10]
MLMFGERRCRSCDLVTTALGSADRARGGRASAGGFGAAVGCWVSAGVLDTGDQDAGGLAGGGQLALSSGLLEELVGLVDAGFGVGEGGGEREPGRGGEDPLGVVGDGCPYVVRENATGFLPGRPACEFGKRRGEGTVRDCLEVLDGLAGGVGLVGVVLRLVPAPSDDGGPDDGGEQGRERAAVGPGGGVDDIARRTAQRVSGAVFGPDLGALGSGERLGGGLEFGAQVGGCLVGGGFEQLAEGRDVGLGVRVVGEIGVEGVERVGGLVPGGAGAAAAGGGVLFWLAGFEADLDLGQREVGGDLASGAEDLLAVLVEVAGRPRPRPPGPAPPGAGPSPPPPGRRSPKSGLESGPSADS